MITIRHIVMPMALLASAALTACGGGGGGSNNGAPSTPSSVEKLGITADNYDQVVASTGAATAQASSSGHDGTNKDAKLTGVESHVLNWSQLAQAAVNQALAKQGGQLLLGAVSNQACVVSGNMSINIEGAAADAGLAVGEVITVDYSACVEEAGSRLDGRLKMKITKLADQDITEMNLDLTSFKVTDSSASDVVTGAMTVTKLPDLYVVNSPALTIVTTSGSVTQTEAWTNFLFTNADSSDKASRQVTFSGLLVSSELGNKSVEVTTPVALTYVGTSTVPNSGKVEIKGANNSIATLKVNSETSPVTISVDTNGDGTAEKSKSVAWDQIVGDDFN
ncbi:MAG: hypothetical protein KGL57_02805 [Burkholderiales bacterium]|nr:hypothetical protein [Burkholderiales bacterium]